MTSTSVTCVPKEAKTSANSHPTAPAPTMIIDLGAFSTTSASSDEITVFLFRSSPICGRPFTREPVDTTIPFFASCFSSLPSAVFTETTFLPASVAVPLIHVILFFLNRNSTPLEFCVLTARERFIATPRSSLTSPGVTPNSGAFFIFSANAAASSIALAGMHPHRTHVPPSPSRSTTAVLSPSWAQRIAPTYPAGPPPRKITSKEAMVRLEGREVTSDVERLT